MKHKLTLCLFNGSFDNFTRHTKPAVITENGANGRAGINAVWRGIAESHFLKNPENVLPDGANAIIFQRLEMAAGFTRVDRLVFLGEG
jgi:hypothetical protein